MKTLKILSLTLVLFAGALSLSACGDTLHGAGHDVEDAGQEVKSW